MDGIVAVRSLLKAKGFSATVVLTLALAIGVNTATFAIVHSVLLRPLALPESERILMMSNQYPKAGVPESDDNSVADYYDRLAAVPAFEEQALFQGRNATLDVQGEPQRLSGQAATPSLFRLLRVSPAKGRTFVEAEGELGNERKVLLSDGLARELFAADNPVGKQIRLDGRLFEVLGVMPKGFQFIDPKVRFWIPAAFSSAEKQERINNVWRSVGRLRPDASIEQARSQISALNNANLERYPQFKQILLDAGFVTEVEPLQQRLVRGVKRILFLLWGGSLLVLAIGGINVANLALARLSSRRKEFATRMALGAGRFALFRQITMENLILAISGGILGIPFGAALLVLSARFGLREFPRAGEVAIDPMVVCVSISLAVLSGLLIALLPLWDVVRLDLTSVLHDEGRSATGGLVAKRVRQGLVALQVGLAFALLVGAGVLLTSFRQLLQVDPGFQLQGVVLASTSVPQSRYSNDEQLRILNARSLKSIRRIPEVSSAATTDTVPFGGIYNEGVVLAEGYRMAKGESLISPRRVAVSTGFFETCKIGLVRGRFFTENDNEKSPLAVIVDERLARKFWPGRNPVGQRIRYPSDDGDLAKIDEKTKWLRVVGVVRNIRMEELSGSPNLGGAYYVPFAQSPDRFMAFMVRGNVDAKRLRAAISEVDPGLALSDVRTLAQQAELSLAPRKAAMSLALGFGALGALLSALGVFSVLSNLVAQRHREFGIRLALGSLASEIVRLVLLETLTLAALGMGAGLAFAFAFRGVLATEVYAVAPLDPVVLATVALALFAAATLASAAPAQRAASVDPAAALRR